MAETALITGGSSGIGFELSWLFAKDGYNLVIVARNRQELDVASKKLSSLGVSVLTVQKDLSDPNAPAEIFDSLQKAKVRVDVLVNNAGFGNFGKFHETDLGKELQMIQVNITALTHLTKLFVKGMVERKKGKILNLASTAAFQPGPLMAVYYASKAYVLHFSEAIANELEGTGVTVSALCPGPTRTGFQKRSDMGDSRLFRDKIMEPKAVAKAGYDGLMKGKTIVIPGLKNRLLAFSVRLTPRKTVARIARSMQERSG
jgi:hypothetical protein